MGRIFVEAVDDSDKVYRCRCCATALTTVDSLISKSFHSRAGRAYLFERVVNVAVGRPEERMMTTGLHTVADLNCVVCWQSCGWKYLKAREESQRYKEGKWILERAKLVDSLKAAGSSGSLPVAAAMDWQPEAGTPAFESSDSESDACT